MSEWFKEHAWKACVGETLPRVRIPLSPPIRFTRWRSERSSAFARLSPRSARIPASLGTNPPVKLPNKLYLVMSLILFGSQQSSAAADIVASLEDGLLADRETGGVPAESSAIRRERARSGGGGAGSHWK